MWTKLSPMTSVNPTNPTDRGNESKAAPISPIDRIVGVLKLGTPTTSLNHTYVKGESLYFPTGRVYGGQVIAQSVVAAARTVEESRLPESIHGLFITAGDIGQDILFDVENLRNGRSFSSRRVNATQRDGAVFTAISNFQEKGQDGFHYQDPMPDDLPAPESLPSMYDLMSPYQKESPFADYYTNQSPFDIRHITSVVLMHRERDAQARRDRQMVWMKADGHVEADQVIHRALLALGCDQLMMEPVIRRSGFSFLVPGISFASLDHSMWWYDDIDMNDWLLFVQETPKAAHSRGLSQAEVYDRSGRLVAAMVQEAMVRIPGEYLSERTD